MVNGRALLHYVFKVTAMHFILEFYKLILGMKVLRSEENENECVVQCNGRHSGPWSKTLLGYGPEATHFAVELIHNYRVKSYQLGGEFLGLTIQSSEILQRAAANNWPVLEDNGRKYLEAPGGYKIYIVDEPQPVDRDPVVKVSLASSNLANSIAYWNGLLTLKIYEQTSKSVLLGFGDNQAKLELIDIGGPVNHVEAGRIAFSCPSKELETIKQRIAEANGVIKHSRDVPTPGKPSVYVIILADPDGHEICFVEEASFRQLSQVDPASDTDLERLIETEGARTT